MKKKKIYNIVGIISTVLLIISMVGNFFGIENTVLNILLYSGIISKFFLYMDLLYLEKMILILNV